jgi:hypothetical protein
MNQWRYLQVAVLAACALCTPLAWGSDPAPQVQTEQALWSQALALHNQARDGKANSAEQAAGLFKALVEREPDNSLAVVYLGSSYTLMARDATVLVDKVRYTNRGIRYMDNALEHGTDNFTVRVVRANVNLSLPEMFKRADAARADILKLDQLYKVAPLRENAALMAPLYTAFAKSLGGAPEWEAKARAAERVAAKKP